MKVLIVDDTPENVYMLEALLKGNGYEVSTAVDGKEALDKLKQEPAALIISDILMPKMDGFQLCRAVKADNALKNIPFIFYTATYTSEKDKEFALSLGASRFILKPADPGEFIAIIKEVLEENKKGLLKPRDLVIEKETEYLKGHQARLIKKLDDKIVELEQSEERYRGLISCAVDAIITLDESGVIISWNEAAEKIFGYSTDEALGKHSSFLVPEDFHSKLNAIFLGLKEKKLAGRLEAFGRLRDGNFIPVVISVSLMKDKHNKVLGFSAIIIDMTEHNRAEEKLRQSEELYRSVFENHSAVKLLIDPGTGNIVDANDAAAKFYGWSREQLKQMKIQDVNMLPPEKVQKEIEKVMNENRVHFEFRHRQANGSIRDVEVFSSKIDTRGKVLLHSIVHDITDRKEAEAALRDSENRYHLLFDQSPDGILIIDPETGRFLDFNEAACKLLGYSREEFVQLSLSDFEINETPEEIQEHIKKITLEGWGDFETRSRTRQGEIKNTHVTAQATEISGRPVLYCVFRDITEHRKLEMQYLHAQKMESIGTLAGGIAHDFNNILSAIIGYGDITLMKMAKDDPLRQNIKDILEAADRATHLTKALLLFSRKRASERKPVDLNEILRKVDKFLKHIIGEDIACKTTFTEHPLMVDADSHQLEQVLMNLGTNARDAMPKGGSFIVQTEEVALQEDFIAAHGYGKPGLYAMITISDTGMGMDEDTRKRIFEPFFTTKEVSKGTGLGLSVVYGIIKQHDGFINVYTEPGQGTTFRIYLPIIMSAAQEETSALQEKTPARGTETVLLAEDDASLRKLSRRVLAEHGYTVIEAIDGEDAVEKFIENKESIQILLIDLIMPKMNGKEAFDEIRKIKPDIKVIFTSGYAPDLVQQKVSLTNGASLIRKPVSPMALVRKVRSILDEK